MKIELEVIKYAQREMGLIDDGIIGINTRRALRHYEAIPDHWATERQIVGFIQYTAIKKDLNPGPLDGYWGPQTEQAFEELTGSVPWRDDEGVGGRVGDPGWPLQVQDELVKYYGAVGENQTSIALPYTHKIAWAPEKSVNKFTCHEKVADSVVRVLERVLDHYGPVTITKLNLDMWGGCLNVRKMRGGTRYSTHSWGIAMDYDPGNNGLRWGRDRASFAKPEYDMWWRFWEDEGWVSLGRTRNYDWMHVQAARVK